MYNKLLLSSACLAAFMSLTGCGGGNGGSSVNPTLPPANAAPVANVTVDKAAVDEGQSFTLNGLGSSDAEGASLTYNWSQISGPRIDGTFDSSSTLELTVPELTETETASFQLEVSDGDSRDRATINITFVNISQSPKTNFELVHSSTISTQNGIKFVRKFGAGFREFAEITSAGSFDFFRVGTSDQGVPVRITEIDSAVPVSRDALFHNPIIRHIRVDGAPFLTVDEASNVVEVIKIDESLGAENVYQSGGQFNIDRPCAIVSPEIDHVIVGQRARGLSLLTLDYRSVGEGDKMNLDSATLEQALDSGQSFCGLGYNLDRNLFAVDYVAKSVSLFDINQSFDSQSFNVARISLVSEKTLPLDLPPEIEGLEIIETVDTGRGVLILLTDGQHNGSHHMIYVDYQDGDFIQKRYSWPKGVPSGMGFARLFSDRTEGVFIASSTSPEAIVFASPNAEFTELAGPQYLEVGLGAQEILSAKEVPFSSTGLLVTFPNKNEIRFLGPR